MLVEQDGVHNSARFLKYSREMQLKITASQKNKSFKFRAFNQYIHAETLGWGLGEQRLSHPVC